MSSLYHIVKYKFNILLVSSPNKLIRIIIIFQLIVFRVIFIPIYTPFHSTKLCSYYLKLGFFGVVYTGIFFFLLNMKKKWFHQWFLSLFLRPNPKTNGAKKVVPMALTHDPSHSHNIYHVFSPIIQSCESQNSASCISPRGWTTSLNVSLCRKVTTSLSATQTPLHSTLLQPASN